MTLARPKSCGCERSRVREPSGLAMCHADLERRSGGRDSGRTKRPYIALDRLSTAAGQKGKRRLTLPRNPPTAGPMMEPMPKEAARYPNCLARFSGGVGSVMKKKEQEMLEGVM